jgi:hypothetical protein
MSRTLLFLVILAALVCVGVSDEQNFRGSISSANKDKGNKNFLNRFLNILHLSKTGQDGSSGPGNEDGGESSGKGSKGAKKENCVVGNWGPWGECYKLNGNCVKKTRSRYPDLPKEWRESMP